MEIVEADSPHEALGFLAEVKRGERTVGVELCIRLTGPYYWAEVPGIVRSCISPARSWASRAFNYHAYKVTVALATGRLPADKYALTADFEIAEGRASLHLRPLREEIPPEPLP